jgi:hypothetical protein
VTPVNFRRSLLSFTRRRPFQPFVAELVSGDRIRVQHPEALVLRGNVVMFIATNKTVRLFDSESVCQLCDESALNPPAS